MLESLDKLHYRKKVNFSASGGDVPAWDDSSHVCWKDWEWDSGQEQCGSKRILLINKEIRHRNFNYRRVKTVVFVSKQEFVF